VDLEQALNYLDLDAAGENFLYEHYTAARLAYRRGSRPVLEQIAGQITAGVEAPLERIQSLARYVAEEIPWAGYYRKATGKLLAPDRGMTEEEIVKSGYGWCMEQARVFCALTQIIGISSRLIFAGNPDKKYGHVLSEVYLPEGWMAVDQSFGLCFRMNNEPVAAARLRDNPEARAHFDLFYREAAAKMINEIGGENLETDFRMLLSDHPIDGFDQIGFCNHFIQ